ncbi:hypothetical protein BV25DRAFT_1816869 [Artomyces pyxidatus]|uniref:Uncharacterized protein n=1 Tax=Artomyces pyxidatus TaxID=48021 RepID=A0ACB8SE30_9AGAM|nr:hypothetical protein BV25DRAFT_1816869 [Artomyces pyxidatus]
MPRGVWGITYDLFTRRIEDNLPNGWGSRRSGVYRRLARLLEQGAFNRVQYSLWEKDDTNATATYNLMTGLRRLQPRGILPTVVKGLQMFSVPDRIRMDITDAVRLGGAFSPYLTGITPANLVPLGVPRQLPPPTWPGNNRKNLPKGLRRDAASLVHSLVTRNWRRHPDPQAGNAEGNEAGKDSDDEGGKAEDEEEEEDDVMDDDEAEDVMDDDDN